jgi:pyruvate,water dikinase
MSQGNRTAASDRAGVPPSGIVWHHQPDALLHVHTLGGKAAALLRLRQTGLSVPAWFVVVPEAEERAVVDASSALARDGVAHDAVPVLLAVRSSARDEDGVAHSFAGQLDSFLSVPLGAVSGAVERVRASAQSERIRAYRREQGLPGDAPIPAVLVQRMVLADRAGVAFSADPVSGRRDVAVVSAVHGLGTALVSGNSSADTWRVGRDARILDAAISHKATRHAVEPLSASGEDAPTHEGVRTESLPVHLRETPALSDAEVLRVAALARACQQHFGRPQDIEWAFENGELWLLQSRPITSLARMPDPGATLRIWDNANIAESYTGITSPLTFTFARMAYEHVYRGFCVLMGVPHEMLRQNDVLFGNMLGSIRGRVYYNLLNWYRVLALLPGFTVNRRFMEGMMGVREGLPEDLTSSLQYATRGQRLRDAWRLALTIGGLLRQYAGLERGIQRFFLRLGDALGDRSPDLRLHSLDELIAHYRVLERQLLSRWDAPLVNDFFAMIFFGLLKKLTASWCQDADGTLQNALLAALGGMISAEPARRMREIAALLAKRPQTQETFAHGSVDAIQLAITAEPALQAAVDAYLARFGDRCLSELKLESPTLEDDPLPFYRSLAQLAQMGTSPHAETIEQQTAAAEATVRTRLRRRPLRRLLFSWVLKNARRLVANRENLRFERTRVFGRVRRIFAECGRRLAEAGYLDADRDVFYLELHEVLGFAEGTVTTTALAALAGARRDAYLGFAEDPAPAHRFETRGAVHGGNRFEAEVSADLDDDDDTRKGLGACPGKVKGRVRVIRDPSGAQMEPGWILVAERTDPGWILLFPLASGLLVEHGSLLSHSAIVSRELGLPAIVSIPGVTAWLQDGDEVEMDGASGIVRLVSRGQHV